MSKQEKEKGIETSINNIVEDNIIQGTEAPYIDKENLIYAIVELVNSDQVKQYHASGEVYLEKCCISDKRDFGCNSCEDNPNRFFDALKKVDASRDYEEALKIARDVLYKNKSLIKQPTNQQSEIERLKKEKDYFVKSEAKALGDLLELKQQLSNLQGKMDEKDKEIESLNYQLNNWRI